MTGTIDHATAIHEWAHGWASGAPFMIGFEDQFPGLDFEYPDGPVACVVTEWCGATIPNLPISAFCGPLAQAAYELPARTPLQLIDMFTSSPRMLEPWASPSDMRTILMFDTRKFAQDPATIMVMLEVIGRARDPLDPDIARITAYTSGDEPLSFPASQRVKT